MSYKFSKLCLKITKQFIFSLAQVIYLCFSEPKPVLCST